MKTLLRSIFVCSVVAAFTVTIVQAQAKKAHKIVGEEVSYTENGTNMKGYVAYDANMAAKRPVVVVVPEWWGVTEYTKRRARMLADLGYFAIVADMYGDGKVAADPKEAQEYATPMYKDPNMGKDRIVAAMAKARTFGQADQHKVAVIGYCFGGSMALNAATMGTNLNGVVCFHGGLKTVPAVKGAVTGKILVLEGGADKFVPAEDIANFRKNLDTAGVSYKYITYPGATHAYTNPDATANGKKFKMPIAYNPSADKKSWAEMRMFLKKVFS
jgi:dienelactone hydrolase